MSVNKVNSDGSLTRVAGIMPVDQTYNPLSERPQSGVAVADAIGGVLKWSNPVSCVVGDTTCTITDSAILTTSVIEDFCENTSGTKIVVPQIDVTAGQAILHFDALTEATSFFVRITNLP